LRPPKPSFWSLTLLVMGLAGYGLAAAIAMLAQG
ncbi:MAG: hypothetical protein JWR43_353, partial [Phenylobacterium sp.]|jgi:hypothetical protein|nr:hypothetical protein [Phenylobacterium sp.]